eukprot:1195377-Prorocentrum_minimum.AAC.3
MALRLQGEFPMDCPMNDCLVRAHWATCLLPGRERVADSRGERGGEPLEFPLGEGLMPPALETSLRLMLPAELSVVTSTAGCARTCFQFPMGDGWRRIPQHEGGEFPVKGGEFPTKGGDFTAFLARQADEGRAPRASARRAQRIIHFDLFCKLLETLLNAPTPSESSDPDLR